MKSIFQFTLVSALLSLITGSPTRPPYKPHKFSIHKRDGLVPSNSGDPALMTNDYGHYPRANYLNDGSIIGTFTEFSSPDPLAAGATTTIKVVFSTDNGQSWSGDTVVYSNNTHDNDIDNPYVLEVADNRILLVYRNHYRPDFNDEVLFRLSVSYSDDGGATWTFQGDAVTKVPSVPGAAEGIWEPFLRIALDGSLQLYYSEENNSGDQDSKLRISTNNGATWSDPPILVSGGNVNARDGMLGVVDTTGNGNLIAVFETTENPGNPFVVDSVTSNDDGSTWGNRQRVFTPPSGKSAGSPQVANVGGAIVACFMNSENAPTDAYNGTAVTLLTSGDQGGTWGNEYNAFSSQANDPGVLTNGNSSLLVMTSLDLDADGDFDGPVEAQTIVLS